MNDTLFNWLVAFIVGCGVLAGGALLAAIIIILIETWRPAFWFILVVPILLLAFVIGGSITGVIQ